MTNPSEWLAQVFGGTLKQTAFYQEVFQNLLQFGKVYILDIHGFPTRSKRFWMERLTSLGVVRQTRDGFQGKWVYKLSTEFLANLEKVYFTVKKVL